MKMKSKFAGEQIKKLAHVYKNEKGLKHFSSLNEYKGFPFIHLSIFFYFVAFMTANIDFYCSACISH